MPKSESPVGKVAKIGWSGLWHEILQDDGKGKVAVRFILQFGLLDASDSYIACAGVVRYWIRVWRAALVDNTPGDLRLQIVTGAPGYSMGKADSRDIYEQQEIRVSSFVPSNREKGFLGVTTHTRPIWLKKDVSEWRYNYEIWFRWGALLTKYRYEGYTSQYWSFDLRG